MARCFRFLAVAAACTTSVSAQAQQPLRGSEETDSKPIPSDGKGSGGLHGRFLHITDIHPDYYYKPGTSTSKAHGRCHSGSGDETGYLGAEGTSCDSPLTLVNETFKWINENLRDSIDFVIWTGDSARHDKDENIPRTEQEIVELNQLMTDKMVDVFKSDDPDSAGDLTIPIVPNIGNNDIMPHNILKDGPNRWTKRFMEIWHKFIPEEQRHTFHEGGWFFSEVIPDKLAVISLNTMYFYDKNSAVDGCKHKSEPGYDHMEWLRVQLQSMRKRKMKAILIGHVPPARTSAKENWDESCWQKYTLWLRQFRDVVVGSAFGHMNVDHFMLQDAHDITIADVDIEELEDEEFCTRSRVDYLDSLKATWGNLPSAPKGYPFPHVDMEEQASTIQKDPEDGDADDDFESEKSKKKKKKKKIKKFLKKIDGPLAERYSLSLVSPSVIPNYFPSLRVVEYNISGLEHTPTWAEVSASSRLNDYDDYDQDENPTFDPESDTNDEDDDEDDDDGKENKLPDDANSSKKKKKKKKPKFKVPKPPSKSSPPGPAYSNQPLTWLGYTQYFANLTRLNEKIANMETESIANSISSWREFLLDRYTGSKDGKKPKDPIPFEYEVEYDTRTDEIYQMEDMTVKSYFGLASVIADSDSKNAVFESSDTDSGMESEGDDTVEIDKKEKKKKVEKGNKVWNTFVKRAFVGYRDG